jgi:flagellar biosynthesis protein FlhB
MFKHILLLVGLSVAAIFFQDQLMHALKFFMYVHNQLANGLGVIFSVDKVGEVVQSVLALLLIPIVIGVVLALAHFFIRKQHFPHMMTTIWVAWAVLLVSVLSQTGHVTDHAASAAPTTQTAQGAPGAPGAPSAPGTPGANPAAPPIPQQG